MAANEHSHNNAMQPTPATLGGASLAASQSADGGRYVSGAKASISPKC